MSSLAKKICGVAGVVALFAVGILTLFVQNSHQDPRTDIVTLKQDVRNLAAITHPGLAPMRSTVDLFQPTNKLSRAAFRTRVRRLVRNGLRTFPAARRRLAELRLSSPLTRKMRDIDVNLFRDLEAAYRRVSPTLRAGGAYRIVRFADDVNRAQARFRATFGKLTYTDREAEAVVSVAGGS